MVGQAGEVTRDPFRSLADKGPLLACAGVPPPTVQRGL